MISMKEIMGKEDYDSLDQTIKDNLDILLDRVNKLRALWGKPMYVTSGFRSKQKHLAIYAAKGITDESKIPMKSKHIFGLACDFSDPDGSLKDFVKANNYQILIDCELWMEAESATPNWLHVQIVPPKSGKREFLP